jgi:hypothetical protein
MNPSEKKEPPGRSPYKYGRPVCAFCMGAAGEVAPLLIKPIPGPDGIVRNYYFHKACERPKVDSSYVREGTSIFAVPLMHWSWRKFKWVK